METVELPVVVGVDGSDGSLEALDWAAREAERSSRELRVVYAPEWGRYESYEPRAAADDRPAETVTSDSVIAVAMARVHRLAPEVKVAAASMPDEPVSVLLSEGDSASMLVVGSRGRGPITGMLLGSVSLAVAARARCPVAVVRGPAPLDAGADAPVVLAVGETAASDAAARFAYEQAQRRGVPLLAVRAWRSPAPDVVFGHGELSYDPVEVAKASHQRADMFLDRTLRVIGEDYPSVRARRDAVEGPAHQMLVQAAEGAALLVVGAQRRSGTVVGLQLGRVNHAVLHHSPCPVVVVPDTR